MVLDYVWEISTTLISFGYSNVLEISIAIFIIVLTIISSLWFWYRAKQKRKDDEIGINNNLIKQGLQARFKQAQHKLIEEKLSLQDRDEEKERESETLKAVMKLLQERKDLFPESSMDELKEQLNLYRTQ